MNYANLFDNYAAATRAEMRGKIVSSFEQQAITDGTFTRTEEGQLSGLEIPFKRGVVHGSTALNPYNGTTSFGRMIAPPTNKMYVGTTFQGFTVEDEYFHAKDASRGKLPETESDLRDMALATFMQEQNWYAIGDGTGTLAVATSLVGTLLTCAFDNTALGRSKGSIRLAPTYEPGTPSKRIVYQSVIPATNVIEGSFYVDNLPSTTTANITLLSGTVTANSRIVKEGHWRAVPYGLGYHIDPTPRIYQGADTSVNQFLNSRNIDGGGALVTPSVIDAAKGSLQTRANNANARKNRVCHITIGNYKVLSAFGYTLREYNAEKGDANTTFGLPFIYEDEDTLFVQDAHMEDAAIFMRDRKSYFKYVQADLAEVTERREQYVGVNLSGSTERYRNWGKSDNLAWDMRGDDGSQKLKMGAPNSSVLIDNLEIPDNCQVNEGLNLMGG